MGIKDQKLVVYTCLTGDYEQPVKMHELEENINYICFSDKESSAAEGWEYRKIEGLDHLDDKDKNRYLKMNKMGFETIFTEITDFSSINFKRYLINFLRRQVNGSDMPHLVGSFKKKS